MRAEPKGQGTGIEFPVLAECQTVQSLLMLRNLQLS